MAAGLPAELTFHRLRHSAGYHLRQVGEPLELIQKRLRHASIRTTADVYGSLPPELDRAAAARITPFIERRADIAEAQLSS
jgi:integrase